MVDLAPTRYMKTSTTNALLLVSALLVTGASAFTLDFASLAIGTPVPNAPGGLTLNVAGFGDIKIQSALGSSLEISTHTGLNAVNFTNTETLVVTFLGGPLSGDPEFDYKGVSGGESFSSLSSGPGVYEVTFIGTNGGVSAIHFIPEPSSLTLCTLGALALIRRRR